MKRIVAELTLPQLVHAIHAGGYRLIFDGHVVSLEDPGVEVTGCGYNPHNDTVQLFAKGIGFDTPPFACAAPQCMVPIRDPEPVKEKP